MTNKEQHLYLDTIKHLNFQHQKIKQLEKKTTLIDRSYNNLKDTLFVVLYSLEQINGSMINHKQLTNLLSKIKSVSYNGLLDIPIKKYYEDETLKGGILVQKTLEDYKDRSKNCIDMTTYKNH